MKRRRVHLGLVRAGAARREVRRRRAASILASGDTLALDREGGEG